MDIYLARQPIFDKHQNVYGYELLYRESQINSYFSKDADKASSNVMLNSFHVIGIDKLTAGKKAFINFTEGLLKQGVATLFPNDKLVVEILETVKPQNDIIESCKDLKKRGYIIALDDFVFQQEYLPLINLADIIKVDFLSTPKHELKNIVRRLKDGKIKFLAEKVETYEDFENAKEWGYSLFQGYFFSKPVILSVQDIPPLKFNYLQLIQKVNKNEFDFEEVSEIVSRDVSLSYKLLRMVNSVDFGFQSRIKSVRQALVVLGTEEVKKWVSLIAIKGLGDGQSDEIVSLSLVRARFLEQLSADLYNGENQDKLFLIGLFSKLDVLMNRPMEEILKEISISEEITNALIKKEGIDGWAYQLILAYENADWDQVCFLSQTLKLSRSKVSKAYLEAIAWSYQLENEAIEL